MSHPCIHLSPLTCGSSTSNPDSATEGNNKQQQIRVHIKKEELEDETRELGMEYGSPSGPQQYWFFEHDMIELEQMTTRCACGHCTAQSPGSTIPQQEKEVRFLYQLLTIPAKPKTNRVPRTEGTNLASSRISQCPISLVPETVEICSDCGLAKKSLPNLRLKDSQYYALMSLFQLKYPNMSKEELTHFCKRNHICLKLRKLIMNWFQKMQTHFVVNSTSTQNASQIDQGTVQVEGIKQEPEEEEEPESCGPIPAQVPLPPLAWVCPASEEAAQNSAAVVLEHDTATIPTVPGTQLAQDDPEVTERVQLDSPEIPELQDNVQKPNPIVPETVPETEPKVQEPEPTVPEPSFPEPEPTVPEPEPTVPEPKSTFPEPEPTVPETESTVPVIPEVVPEPVAPPSSRPPRRLAFIKCDQTLDLMMVYGLLETRNPTGPSPKRRAPRRSNSIRHNNNNKRTRN